MSAEGYLTELFCSCVCFPAVLLCYLPMKNRLKYGKKMTLACAVISCPNDVRFGIVSSNSFCGKVRMDGERYLSTHRGGSGIGLSSIRAAAERYGGTASFSHEEKEFIIGVVIPYLLIFSGLTR